MKYGNILGEGIGHMIDKAFFNGDGSNGRSIGGSIGTFLPFHKGGILNNTPTGYADIIRAKTGLRVKKAPVRKIQKRKKKV